MARLRDSYTRYPRPILWLVRGGSAGERTIAPFYLSKRPVTNVQFEACVERFERSPLATGDDDPVLGVTFDEARAYCAWYAEVSRKPMRLPSDIEWDHACGPVPEPGIVYTNPFGLTGMLDGVAEFCVKDDGTAALRGNPEPRDATGAGFRVARSLQ